MNMMPSIRHVLDRTMAAPVASMMAFRALMHRGRAVAWEPELAFAKHSWSAEYAVDVEENNGGNGHRVGSPLLRASTPSTQPTRQKSGAKTLRPIFQRDGAAVIVAV